KASTGPRFYFSSSGLGLAICRKLARAMRSELRVETRPHWVTRFSFELELPPATAATCPMRRNVAPGPHAPTARDSAAPRYDDRLDSHRRRALHLATVAAAP